MQQIQLLKTSISGIRASNMAQSLPLLQVRQLSQHPVRFPFVLLRLPEVYVCNGATDSSSSRHCPDMVLQWLVQLRKCLQYSWNLVVAPFVPGRLCSVEEPAGLSFAGVHSQLRLSVLLDLAVPCSCSLQSVVCVLASVLSSTEGRCFRFDRGCCSWRIEMDCQGIDSATRSMHTLPQRFVPSCLVPGCCHQAGRHCLALSSIELQRLCGARKLIALAG